MEHISGDFLASGLIWFLVFLFSTTCHEAAHALAAKLGGDLTAFHGGQVTLNPAPHVVREPFGMVVVPILSYLLGGWMIGWASSPYDPSWQQRYPRRAALMSLAGPAANFTLALIAAIGIHAGIGLGVFQIPYSINFGDILHIAQLAEPETAGQLTKFAGMFLSVLFFLNILLGTFNLMPVPPLDGSTGITVFMNERIALRFIAFVNHPSLSMTGLLAAWFLFDKIFTPVARVALRVLYFNANYF